MSDVTPVLMAIERAEPDAVARLLPLVYDELRRIANRLMHREKADHTLQATALAHEACIRMLTGGRAGRWQNRSHFYATAAETMRRILIDSARRKLASKRSGHRRRVALAPEHLVVRADPDRVLALDEALTRLAAEDDTAAQIATLHLFGELSIGEAAAVTGVSRATGYRLWTYARAWLRVEMSASAGEQ